MWQQDHLYEYCCQLGLNLYLDKRKLDAFIRHDLLRVCSTRKVLGILSNGFSGSLLTFLVIGQAGLQAKVRCLYNDPVLSLQIQIKQLAV